MLTVLWERFLLLGWTGRVIAVIAGLYGAGWVLGGLGLNAAARQLGSGAIFILSLLLTWLIIRWVWRNHAGRPQR